MCHTDGLLRRASMVVHLEANGLEARFWTSASAFVQWLCAAQMIVSLDRQDSTPQKIRHATLGGELAKDLHPRRPGRIHGSFR